MALQPTQPPSDLTLDQSWVALKPGSYPARTDLTPFKGTNLTEGQLLDYRPESPFGVGDSQSVVYIYPQGTIEIIGNVYCWNKLIKPGVYSQFEKIRYLTGEEVLPREKNIYSHHAAYDKTLRVKSPYITTNTEGSQTLLQYNYVSFNTAILQKTGDKIYPIPIFDGKLTIYPDGTFKTENIVVTSDSKELVHPYGYLGDNNPYGYFKTYFELYKDADNVDDPIALYKLVSRNEDGSTTYEAVEENKNAIFTRPPMIPLGIIPINDGEVTVGYDGWVSIKGTVINSYGYLIKVSKLYYPEFCWVEDNLLKYNEDYLDKTKLFNPTVYYPCKAGQGGKTKDGFEKVILSVADGNTDIYRYHPDNDSYYITDVNNAKIATYTKMKGWDTFTSNTPRKDFKYLLENMLSYWDFVDETSLDTLRILDNQGHVNKTYYPWVSKHPLRVSSGFRVPTIRINPIGGLERYLTIDHSMFWDAEDIYPTPKRIHHYSDLNDLGIEQDKPVGEFDDTFIPSNYEQYVNFRDYPLPQGLDNIFYPYLTQRRNTQTLTEPGRSSSDGYEENASSFQFTDDPATGKLMIEIKGDVIWKRGDQYYTLYPGKVVYDTAWPDIEDNHQLFDVNGYFTQEPIFITRDKNDIGNIDNRLVNIDGIKRQEEGLFKLVKRNVTNYLSPLEKRRIDITNLDDKPCNHPTTFKILTNKGWYKGKLYTHRLTRGYLNYFCFRYNDVFPSLLDAREMAINTSNTSLPTDTRIYSFDRRNSKANVYLPGGMNLYALPFIIEWNSAITLSREVLPPIKYLSNVSNREQQPINGLTRLTSSSIYHNERGRLQLPTFTVPTHWIATDFPSGRLNVRVSNANDVTFFYRYMDDTETISGSFVASGTNTYSIRPTFKHKESYVEVWYDDPFDETEGINIKRVLLRKDRNLNPIQITEPEGDIYNTQRTLRGVGEPNGVLELWDMGSNPNVLIKTVNISKEGVWKLDDLSLETTKTYRLLQKNLDFNLQSHIDFTVIKKPLNWNDSLTPIEMFGRDIYLIPFDFGNVVKMGGHTALVRSRIDYRLPDETYTITGMVGDNITPNKFYREGTYKIGTLPPSYTITDPQLLPIHNNEHIAAYNRNMASVVQQVKNGKALYHINQSGYPAKVTNAAVHTSWTLNPEHYDINKLEFLSPMGWKKDVEHLFNNTTVVNNALLNKLNITKPVLKTLLDNPIKYLVPDSTEEWRKTRFGRFGNHLVFESSIPTFVIPGTPEANLWDNVLYLSTPNQTGLKIPTNGVLKPIDLLNRLTRVEPWHIDLVDSRVVEYVDGSESVGYESIITPRGLYKVKTIKQIDNRVDRDINYNSAIDRYWVSESNLSIYKLINWDTIRKEEELQPGDNREQIVYYKLNYSYTLTSDYIRLSESNKMSTGTYNHWRNKGLNPELFTFDKWTNLTRTQVIYSKDGESVTITGRVKIGDRYTRNIEQTVRRGSDLANLEYLPYDPNKYLIKEGFESVSSINLTNDDYLDITGFVVVRNDTDYIKPTRYLMEDARLTSIEIVYHRKDQPANDRKSDAYTGHLLSAIYIVENVLESEIENLVFTHHSMKSSNQRYTPSYTDTAIAIFDRMVKYRIKTTEMNRVRESINFSVAAKSLLRNTPISGLYTRISGFNRDTFEYTSVDFSSSCEYQFIPNGREVDGIRLGTVHFLVPGEYYDPEEGLYRHDDDSYRMIDGRDGRFTKSACKHKTIALYDYGAIFTNVYGLAYRDVDGFEYNISKPIVIKQRCVHYNELAYIQEEV